MTVHRKNAAEGGNVTCRARTSRLSSSRIVMRRAESGCGCGLFWRPGRARLAKLLRQTQPQPQALLAEYLPCWCGSGSCDLLACLLLFLLALQTPNSTHHNPPFSSVTRSLEECTVQFDAQPDSPHGTCSSACLDICSSPVPSTTAPTAKA